jgi:hypothetical protein
MSYYLLRTSEFINLLQTPRILYLLKKYDVPAEDRDMIIHLKCSSIKRVDTISELLSYIQMNTSDKTYSITPYIIKRIKWNEAVDRFGFDSDTDTSESEGTSDSVSIGGINVI